MDELKKLLEENKESIQAASNPEELCDLLRQKGIEISAEALTALVRPTDIAALEDDALENVAGGNNFTDAFLRLGESLSSLLGYRGGAVPVTLEQRGRTAGAVTLEQRGGGSAQAVTMDGYIGPNSPKRGTLL